MHVQMTVKSTRIANEPIHTAKTSNTDGTPLFDVGAGDKLGDGSAKAATSKNASINTTFEP